MPAPAVKSEAIPAPKPAPDAPKGKEKVEAGKKIEAPTLDD
jgi:hypothetical protein